MRLQAAGAAPTKRQCAAVVGAGAPSKRGPTMATARDDGRFNPSPALARDVEASGARYPPVKVRAASLGTVKARALHHQATEEMVRDLLKYDEVPGITNMSHVALPPGTVIDRHVHPSKYEVFFVQSGRGAFKVWRRKASEAEEAREEIDLRPGVSVYVGPEEPHEIIPHGEDEPLMMLYFGVVAPEP